MRRNTYYPPEKFVEQANAADPAIFERFSEEHFPECFKEYADLLTWDAPWQTTLDTSNAPFWKWFTGGRLNASYNCVDRHAEASPGKTAIIFVPELESDEHVEISYSELLRQVNEFAAVLRDSLSLKAGDRVTLHMPMVPELAVTMLACARLGVIHSQVFGGFSGNACGHQDRRLRQPHPDHDGRLLPQRPADGPQGKGRRGDRGGQPRRARRSRGFLSGGGTADSTLRRRRWPRAGTSSSTSCSASTGGTTVEPVSMPAEAPLFLMYTSGTTGRPKGCVHSTGGYLAYVAGTSKYYQDIHPDDVYWCMADIGWITGHSYIVYGPLALGTTTVIYEGVPNYPDGGRPWRIAEKLGVNIFHTSPTAIRMLRKVGPEEPKKYGYHFKHMTTVGEPIEPEVWRWYHSEVGKGEAAIVNTWWQTENGGFLGSTLPAPAADEARQLRARRPRRLPGHLRRGRQRGPGRAAAKRATSASAIRGRGSSRASGASPSGSWTPTTRKYNKDPDSKDWRDWPYFAGDGAVRAADGYFRILGRVDDVINVAGHRLGTKEIESAALTVPEVAEAAAVPVIDDIRGRVVEVYVSLKPGFEPSKEMEGKVSRAIETEIGKIARPKNVWIVPDMPKTRSGKIMRRVIASISNFADIGDVTTLANPEIVNSIRHHVQSAKVAGDDVPRELTEAEFEEIKKFGGE